MRGGASRHAVPSSYTMRRDCPRDRTPLVAKEAPGTRVTVDECPKCSGLFLDKNELAKLTGDRKLNEYLRDKVGDDSDSQLVCPACGGIMDAELVGEITVDVCLTCFGLWLDAGELDRLAARDKAAEVPLPAGKREELIDAEYRQRRAKARLGALGGLFRRR